MRAGQEEEELAPGFRCLYLDEVASTNDLARELADEGESAGLFVVAARQTAGRGRHGRVWQSPPGNLYCSLILRPGRLAAETPSLSLVVALALAEAIEDLSFGTVRPQVKWPNDVLADGAKLAGILLEGAADRRGGRLSVVVGIGVNLVWSPPAGAAPYPTTSLVALGLPPLTPPTFLRSFATVLGSGLDAWETAGFAALHARWLARAVGIGQAVELRLGDGVLHGRLVEVDGTGSLCLEGADGRVRRYTAGELILPA